MSNFIFSGVVVPSVDSTHEDQLLDNFLYSYMIPACFIMFTLFAAFYVMKWLTQPRYYTQSNTYYGNSTFATKAETKPVVAYKTARLTFDAVYKNSNVISLHFNGVSGNVYYEMKEDRCRGLKGFHMYKNIDDAFNHDQYGNVVLEVLGYGDVNEYEKGYTTTGQKVLQIIVDSTVFNKDDTIRFFMDHNNLTLKDLYTKQWINHDGVEIIFSPKKPYVFYDGANKCTIPQYIATVTA